MTELLIRMFVKNADKTDDPAIRGKYGAMAGIVGIVCNILLCAAKMLVGIVSGSVSITADAVNNLSDASSSIVTLIGFRLSQKPADSEHPFGHARFEYLSGLAVAGLIIVIGFQLAQNSLEKILRPTPVDFSAALVVVLALSVCVKMWMAVFNRSVGRRIGSQSLEATAADSRNDVITTCAVLAAAIIARVTGVDLDGWIGMAVALFILYSGAGIAKETINPLLGESADRELTHMIAGEITNFDPHVLGFHDLMVHDYGPGQRFASVHVEIDANENVIEMHDMIDNMERMFCEKHRIHLVVHYDPIVTDDAELNRMRAFVQDKLEKIDPRITIHDFRMVRGKEHTNLIFDMALPADMTGREKEIKARLDETVQDENMRYYTTITFDSLGFNQ